MVTTLLTGAAVLLAGCAPDGVLSSNYQFSSQRSDEGIAAFSVVCTGYSGEARFYVNQSFIQGGLLPPARVTVNCNGIVEYKVLRLAAGPHKFISLDMSKTFDVAPDYSSEKFNPIHFTV